MLHSSDYREDRNGKRYQTSVEHTNSSHGSTKKIANRSSSANVEGKFSETQTLIQEAVNELIRGFIAPLTRQLEALTRLVPGLITSLHPSSSPRTELGTTSCFAATPTGLLLLQSKDATFLNHEDKSEP